ncbi:MAG: hypothetical protein OEY07_07400 [Gammaproteobacteria bacterium]|nr:hypothetical protein [Gammaproteobacteria bacterium]
MQKRLVQLLFVLLVLTALPLWAEESPTDIRRTEVDLLGLYNPLGISIAIKGYQRRIYQQSDDPLWDGLYYQYGLQANINPAFIRAGVHLEWLPLAVLQLRLQSDRLYFSGNNGSLLAFPAPTAPFDDDDLKLREGQEVWGEGRRHQAGLTLRAKFGRFIIRNVADVVDFEFPGRGPFYLEREYELLLAVSDRVYSNQIYLLYDIRHADGFSYLGPYHHYVRVRESEQRREQLGITWYREFRQPRFGFAAPRCYLQIGQYLQEPNRTDEGYLIVGIGGDL